MASYGSSSNNFGLLVLFALLFAPSGAKAVVSDSVLSELRSRLSPKLQTELEKHCGTHCPGFLIDASASRAASPAIEDLGFTSASTDATERKHAERVVVRVLTDESVNAVQIATLRRILSFAISNEITVPAAIEFQRVKAIGESLTRPATPPPDFFDRFEQVQAGFWPIAAVILALFGLLALVICGRYALRIVREKKVPVDTAPVAQMSINSDEPTAEQNKIGRELERLLKDRGPDIRWMIESATRSGDRESLGTVLSLFSAEKLAHAFDFEAGTLEMLCELPNASTRMVNPKDFEWLSVNLDRALWQRLYFSRRPLSRAALLDDGAIQMFLGALPNIEEKALLFLYLPRDKWAPALVTLSSEDRVEIGLYIQKLERGEVQTRSILERDLEQRLKDFEALGGRTEHLIEDYSLYLKDDESRALMQRLTLYSGRKWNSHSLETLLESLPDEQLLELCLRSEVRELQVLFPTLPSHIRERMMKAVPEHLGRRFRSFSQSEDVSSGGSDHEGRVLGARAKILAVTRGLRTSDRLPREWQ